MKTILLLSLILLAAEGASAFGQDRGGGDPCEDQIKVIRDDIASWIQKGGPQGLQLPAQVTIAQYSQSMQGPISKAKIRCVGAGDQGFPVQVFGTPKVCQFETGFLNKGTITCDRTSFLNLSETDQYVLVHHEYAGLAGIETPNKDDSQYGISNQISSFLVNMVVKRLAVKASSSVAASTWRALDGKEGADSARALQDVLDSTKFVDCEVSPAKNETPYDLTTCGGGSYYYIRFDFISKLEKEKGFGRIPVGDFTCGGPKKDDDYSKRYFMKSTSGAPSFRNILDGNVMPVPQYPGAHLQVTTTYELDPTETKIVKVSLVQSRLVQVNKGTIGNPNWVTENLAINDLICHAAQ